MTRTGWVATAKTLGVVVLFAATAGCGGGRNEYRLSKLGFSMELPPGWQQGRPRTSGGWMATGGGMYFFANPKTEQPFGSVIDYPFEGKDLTEYVDKAVKDTLNLSSTFQSLTGALDKMVGGTNSKELKDAQKSLETKLVSKTPLTIGNLEAFEVITESPDSATLEVYIRHGNKVVSLIFRAPRKDWPKFKPLMQTAVKTIKIQ